MLPQLTLLALCVCVCVSQFEWAKIPTWPTFVSPSTPFSNTQQILLQGHSYSDQTHSLCRECVCACVWVCVRACVCWKSHDSWVLVPLWIALILCSNTDIFLILFFKQANKPQTNFTGINALLKHVPACMWRSEFVSAMCLFFLLCCCISSLFVGIVCVFPVYVCVASLFHLVSWGSMLPGYSEGQRWHHGRGVSHHCHPSISSSFHLSISPSFLSCILSSLLVCGLY